MSDTTAPNEREHFDGCLTEHTWDEDDCNCRPGDCPVCGHAVRSDGKCRWAPKGHAPLAPPETTGGGTDE